MLNAKNSNKSESRKINLSKCCFEGGTSLNWNVFKPRLFAEMKSKQAFDYVAVTIPGAVDDQGNPIEKVPDFHRPCATGDEGAYVQAQLDSQIQAINDTLAANTEIINHSAQMNANAKGSAITQMQVKANDDITKINNSRGSVIKDLETSIALYEKRLDNFDQRKADAIKVFYTMLGTGPMSIAEPHLRNGNPRAAFVALDTHYNAGVGGQQAASTIMTQLQGFSVDLDVGSLSEHMNALKNLAVEWEGGGLNPPLPPAYLLLTFLVAVERYTSEYKDEVQFIRQNSLTWDAAMLKLQEREAALTVEKAASPKKKGNRKSDGSRDEIHSLLTKIVKKHLSKVRSATESASAAESHESPKKKVVPVCGKCKKRGHTTEQCWVDMICPQCNQKGHIPKFCPEITGKSFGSPKKPVKVSELLQK